MSLKQDEFVASSSDLVLANYTNEWANLCQVEISILQWSCIPLKDLNALGRKKVVVNTTSLPVDSHNIG